MPLNPYSNFFVFIDGAPGDEEALKTILPALRAHLPDELRTAHGDDKLAILTDPSSAAWKDAWVKCTRPDGEQDTCAIMIAALTPRYFITTETRDRLSEFLGLEFRRQRADLVLPVQLLPIPDFTSDWQDSLTAAMARRPVLDWTALRRIADEAPQRVQAFDTLAHIAAARLRAIRNNRLPFLPRRPGEEDKPIVIAANSYQTGPREFRTLAEAIKAATPGSRIHVRSAQSTERLIIDKPLDIMGEGYRGAAELTFGRGSAITITAPDVRLANLTITCAGDGDGEGSDDGYAITIKGERAEITNCTIKAHKGVFINTAEMAYVHNNIITAENAIRTSHTKSAIVSQNTINKGERVFTIFDGDCIISHNTITDAKYNLTYMQGHGSKIFDFNTIGEQCGISTESRNCGGYSARGNIKIRGGKPSPF